MLPQPQSFLFFPLSFTYKTVVVFFCFYSSWSPPYPAAEWDRDRGAVQVLSRTNPQHTPNSKATQLLQQSASKPITSDNKKHLNPRECQFLTMSMLHGGSEEWSFPKSGTKTPGVAAQSWKIQNTNISKEEPTVSVCRSLVDRKAPFPKKADKKTVMEHLRTGKSQNRYTRPWWSPEAVVRSSLREQW